MTLKTQAFLLNFLSSALFFLGFRFGLPLVVNWPPLWLAVAAGGAALVLSPKFLVSPDRKNPKLLMRWLWSGRK